MPDTQGMPSPAHAGESASHAGHGARAERTDVDAFLEFFENGKRVLSDAKARMQRLLADLERRERAVRGSEEAVAAQQRELALERARFEREAALVADRNLQACDIVRLNIGGERRVSVARSTLTLYEDSMLGAMFSGRHKLAIDSEGYYFLDRDPTYVHYVLEFLRNGGRLPANMPPPSDPEYARIREEFDYFLLADVAFGEPEKSLVELIREDAFHVEALVSEAALEPEKIRAVALSERFAAVVYDNKTTKAIEAWELETGELVYAGAIRDDLYVHELVIRGSTLEAVHLRNGTVHVFSTDLDSPGPLAETLLVVPDIAYAFSPALAESWVAMIGRVGEVDWDWEATAVWLVHRETKQAQAIAEVTGNDIWDRFLRASGRYLIHNVNVRGDVVSVWDTELGALVQSLKVPGPAVDAGMSQDGKELFVLWESGCVNYDIGAARLIRNGATCSVYAFKPKHGGELGPESAGDLESSASLVPLRSFFTGGCARDKSSGFDNTLTFSGDLLAWTDAMNERCGLVDCTTGMVAEVPVEDCIRVTGRSHGWAEGSVLLQASGHRLLVATNERRRLEGGKSIPCPPAVRLYTVRAGAGAVAAE